MFTPQEGFKKHVFILVQKFDCAGDALVYTGEMPDNIEAQLLEWLATADYYDLPHLKQYCGQMLKEAVDADNVIDIARLVCRYDARELQESMKRALSENFEELKGNEGWEEMKSQCPQFYSEVVQCVEKIFKKQDRLDTYMDEIFN